MPDLTPAQIADLDQAHAAAEADLDKLIEAHCGELARHDEVVATARLMLRLAEESPDVAAGFAGLAVTRLVQVMAELGEAVKQAAAWMEEATHQAAERDTNYAEVQRLTGELATVTGQRDDALQVIADLRPHVGGVTMPAG